MTHTYAILVLSKAAWKEIRDKLAGTGYEDQIHDDKIDMHGIAVQADSEEAEPRKTTPILMSLVSIVLILPIALLSAWMVWKILHWYGLMYNAEITSLSFKQVVGLFLALSYLPTASERSKITKWGEWGWTVYRGVCGNFLKLGIAFVLGKLV